MKNPIITNKLRLVVYFVVFIITAALALSFYTSIKVRGIFIDNSKKLLEHNVFLLTNSVEQFYAQTLDNVQANFKIFRSNIYNDGSFYINYGETKKQQVLNQITRDTSEVDLPVMYYNQYPVLNNFALVDNTVDEVQIDGLTTTIFQVIDRGLLRITTNVKTVSDERAVGTYIPLESPVYRTVMRGKVYRGRAYVVNQWYWTVYEPIFDQDKVIGVLYMGIKESVLLKVLKKTFSTVKLNTNGYAYIQDERGFLIIHPFNEGMDGSDFVSEDGVRLFDYLKSKDQGWVEYMYPRPDQKGNHKKLTRFMKVKELNWIVAAGVYADELYSGFVNYEIIYAVFFISLLTIAGSFIAINTFKTNAKLIENSEELKKLAVDAENANIAKSVFLANMSHEIRTPLNSIIGFSELLSSSKLPVQELEYSGTITKSAKSLLNIINNILDISKIESGKVNVSNEPFSLRKLVDDVVRMFSERAKDAGIRFVYLYNSDIPAKLYGDSMRIQQVLVNLLGNAIKFTPENGEVLLNVSIKSSKQNSIVIHFEVSDTGIGIPKEAQKEIFNPFSQADSGVSRSYGGTGLGLTICTKLLNMMNSEIELESAEGEGSTFRFSLELQRVEGEQLDTQKPSSFRHLKFGICRNNSFDETAKQMIVSYLDDLGSTFEYPSESELKPDMIFSFDVRGLVKLSQQTREKHPEAKIVFVGDRSKLINESIVDYVIDHPVYSSKIYNTIVQACRLDDTVEVNTVPENIFKGLVLVAEDNITNQILMKIVLEQLGLSVDFVSNGQAVLEYCLENTPDLILMDINMPVMDGVTAYNQLKEFRYQQGKSYIPVVALTANAVKGDKEKYLATGMDEYLSKPLDKQKLIRVLNRFIKTKNSLSLKENRTLDVYTDTEAVFDKKASVAKIGIKESEYDVILSNLFMNLDKDMAMLEDAVIDKDAESIFSILHYIKGAAVNLHLTPVTGLLEKYTIKAKNGDTEGYDLPYLRYKFNEIKKLIHTD